MAAELRDYLVLNVTVGIYGNPAIPYLGVSPPPHKGWINAKGNYTFERSSEMRGGGTLSCSFDAIPNSDCNWLFVAWRWKLDKHNHDYTRVDTETGVWEGDPHKVIEAAWSQYHDSYCQLDYYVTAEFVFQGSGNLMIGKRTGNLVCNRTGNLIIDR